MKYRSSAEVYGALVAAGVTEDDARTLSKGAGKTRRKAQEFVAAHKEITISVEAQGALFNATYTEYIELTREAICSWTGRTGSACSTFWNSLDPAIQDLLVDLRYRGDLTRWRWSNHLKSAVESGELDQVANVMDDTWRWRSVPTDRFQRRVDFLESALSPSGSPSN